MRIASTHLPTRRSAIALLARLCKPLLARLCKLERGHMYWPSNDVGRKRGGGIGAGAYGGVGAGERGGARAWWRVGVGASEASISERRDGGAHFRSHEARAKRAPRR